MFGIYSNIVDASSVRQLEGRPEALSRTVTGCYGPRDEDLRTGSPVYTGAAAALAHIRVAYRNVHN